MPPLRDFIMAYGQTNLAYYDETPHGDSCMVCELEGVYTPRDAVESPLYQTVLKNLETYLADNEQRGRPVPFFVEREMRAFLDCGIPAMVSSACIVNHDRTGRHSDVDDSTEGFIGVKRQEAIINH